MSGRIPCRVLRAPFARRKPRSNDALSFSTRFFPHTRYFRARDRHRLRLRRQRRRREHRDRTSAIGVRRIAVSDRRRCRISRRDRAGKRGGGQRRALHAGRNSDLASRRARTSEAPDERVEARERLVLLPQLRPRHVRSRRRRDATPLRRQSMRRDRGRKVRAHARDGRAPQATQPRRRRWTLRGHGHPQRALRKGDRRSEEVRRR